MAGEHFLQVAFTSPQRRHVHALLSIHSVHIWHLL